jgi:hypothetical protein
MLAVPEISKMESPFKSIRMPRENALPYLQASFRTEWLVMARLTTGAVVTSASSS